MSTPQTAANDIYRQAQPLYIAAGWTGVLPVPPGTKWPPPEGHTGRDGQDPTPTQTDTWANTQPDSNIALRVPHGIVGIDIDVYGSKRGDDTLHQLEEQHGPLPPTWSSTSRGAGPSRIYLYRCDPTIELPGKLGDSIEAIQHHHRYLVVWPSIVEGRRYHWYDPTGHRALTPPAPTQLAELPDTWQHNLRPPPRPVILDPARRPTIVNPGEWSRAVTRYHAEGVNGLRDQGGRHDSMLPVVLTLVRLDHDGHPGANEALDDLHGRFINAIADRSSHREAESEWNRLVTGAERHVAVTPSLRGPYDTLKPATRQHPAGQGAAQPDHEEPWEWEHCDGTEHADGTYQPVPPNAGQKIPHIDL